MECVICSSFPNRTICTQSQHLFSRRSVRKSISCQFRRRFPKTLPVRHLLRIEHHQKTVVRQLQRTHAVVSPDDITSGQSSDQTESYRPDALRVPSGQLTPIRSHTPLPAEDLYQEPSDGSRSWRLEDNGYLLKILDSHVYDVAIRTPLEKAEKLSMELENTVLLKREDLQPVFSFKCRGAYNLMSNLTKSQLSHGVICSSAGNHAQGVALAAAKLHCDALICMPTSTPSIKIDAVKRLGGKVKLIGASYQETQDYALALSEQQGRIFIPPFDDPFTIAGQGTIGKEILDGIPPSGDLDAVFVAVGGGGLISGIASYIKAIRPNVQVIGVEPVDANAMALSLSKGHRVRLSQVDAFADGVAVKQVGKETFRLCRELIDGIVLVDNSACSAAIKDVYNETRSILEPAGALALAGAKAYLQHNQKKQSTVVAVCSGANINFNNLRLVADLADVGARKEAILASKINETAGTFRSFVETALNGTQLNITEFKYRYSAGSTANIMWGVSTETEKELGELMGRLNGAGFDTIDVSDVDELQLLVRNFVGGRPRSYMGEVPNERVLKITFPERQGALMLFLDVVSPRWNVTMFSYRNIGSEASAVMLGIQLPPEDEEEFATAISSLNGFDFKSISEKGNQLYEMFLK
eukprot:g3485.t1